MKCQLFIIDFDGGEIKNTDTEIQIHDTWSVNFLELRTIIYHIYRQHINLFFGWMHHLEKAQIELDYIPAHPLELGISAGADIMSSPSNNGQIVWFGATQARLSSNMNFWLVRILEDYSSVKLSTQGGPFSNINNLVNYSEASHFRFESGIFVDWDKTLRWSKNE